jgi:hypothetical protein
MKVGSEGPTVLEPATRRLELVPTGCLALSHSTQISTERGQDLSTDDLAGILVVYNFYSTRYQ